MKKNRSVSLALALLLALSLLLFPSCGKEVPAAPEETSAATTAYNAELPGIAFTANVDTVSPGEEFTVVFELSDAPLLACFTAQIGYDSDVIEYVSCDSYSEKGYYDLMNEIDNAFCYSGYVATTFDVVKEDMVSAVFRVGEDVKPGSDITVTLDITELRFGTDERGDDVYDVSEQIDPVSVTVKVA